MKLICTCTVEILSSCFANLQEHLIWEFIISPLTGHNFQTCCYDWHRGPDFKPMGSICKEIWLSSIDGERQHKVCVNLSSNYSKLQWFLLKWIVLLGILPLGIEIHVPYLFFFVQLLQNPTCICCWCRLCTYYSLEGWWN